MDKEYYKTYYTYERNHWWFKVREKIIRARIKHVIGRDDNHLTILNVGVATGRSTEFLSQFGNVTSVEFDKDCCKFLQEHLEMEVINASITDLPFESNVFDLVCAFDVVEHVEEDTKAMSELQRVTKKNGNVIITVPAFMELWSNHDEVNHHVRRYRVNQLEKLLSGLNLNNLYSTYFNSILFLPILIVRVLSRMPTKEEEKETKKSDFEVYNVGFLNQVFLLLFSIEPILLKHFRFPFGVSILMSFTKSGSSD